AKVDQHALGVDMARQAEAHSGADKGNAETMEGDGGGEVLIEADGGPDQALDDGKVADSAALPDEDAIAGSDGRGEALVDAEQGSAGAPGALACLLRQGHSIGEPIDRDEALRILPGAVRRDQEGPIQASPAMLDLGGDETLQIGHRLQATVLNEGLK